MSSEMMRKLRTIAIQAAQKIHLNRHKRVDTSKWPEKGYDEEGRNYLLCPRSFLYDKIQEEIGELRTAIEADEPTSDVLKEAGDVTAVAMFIADHTCDERGVQEFMLRAPKVVCLCGSTRFKQEFVTANFEETMKGNIVLSVGFFAHVDSDLYDLKPGEKEKLDELHKRKIDLADEIFVLNVGGYIGDSTRSEIEYATKWGKPVRYLQIPND